ncbi:TIM-barrel domain-containing protein [Desertivirga xinjiangensis]|uniref:TIM-barrel domain-containing protein n=1 Tax=Desertivirga xinjiangensis TaxID=539206 RepID=UPI00210A2354|nr:TIM-barrel domain-containing protein [Pedobacter xinjiangensis]
MKANRFLVLLLFNFYFCYSFAQLSFRVEKDIAVFYPKDFDSVQTLPSPAVIHTLHKKYDLPEKWTLLPEFKSIAGKSIVEIKYEPGTDLYGTGEVTGSLLRNGKNVTLWNSDNGNYLQFNGERLYQSHPWVLGVRKEGTAFGILADHTWKQQIKLGESIQIISDGPTFRVIVIEKKSPQEVIKCLASLTGTMQLPPMWALGYQQSRFSYYPQGQVKEIADNFRSKKIPIDVIWMDINYMDEFKIFTFDPKGYPDPKELNNYLHSKNVKSVYMIDPGVKKQAGYEVYDEGEERNYWIKNSRNQPYVGKVWPEQCVFPDFINPEVQTWWSSLYKNFMDLGIDGVWNDMNEPSVFNGPEGSMPPDNMHKGGNSFPDGPHLRYHNIYGMMMVQATRKGILDANPGKRPFVLSRSNFLGGQRYAATWTGDNKSSFEHLKTSIPMSINLGLSGQPFSGPDIGGFSGDCSAELFSQWIALGAYYPFCRNHTSIETVSQEPWAFGEKTERASRTAINRRYKLMPYLYSLFREASVSGMPVMQPLFFADVKDPSLRAEEEAFMLGSELIIVPRWAKNVKLPNGNWRNITLEDYDDGYQAQIKIRAGAIVPVGKVFQSTEEYNAEEITLLINPDQKGNASGSLYDDAKDGFGYTQGDYTLLNYQAETKGSDLTVTVKQIAGKRKINQVYRIGLVTSKGIMYSNPQKGNKIKISVPAN